MNHLEDRRSIAAEVLNDLIVYETDEEEWIKNFLWLINKLKKTFPKPKPATFKNKNTNINESLKFTTPQPVVDIYRLWVIVR